VTKPTVRCAVYTRKSSEEGLEQGFSSLDAQREACLAFVASQRHEGWRALPEAYDDGGVSGGTLERPALQRLLAAIRSNKVDVVVVYKVDRLTRALSDFARLVEIFDRHEVTFVSVTQQFNTTTSMGRLTLNVLLSFAQFEREVTGERIRDKIAASTKKGMWMGGYVPLGYDARDRSLVVNAAEAGTVRTLFRLYLEHGCVRRVHETAKDLGLATKLRRTEDGRMGGGRPLSRGHIYQVLGNPLYAGRIAHKGEVYDGLHEAIVDRETWDAVQEQLARNRVDRRDGRTAREPSLLAGRATRWPQASAQAHCGGRDRRTGDRHGCPPAPDAPRRHRRGSARQGAGRTDPGRSGQGARSGRTDRDGPFGAPPGVAIPRHPRRPRGRRGDRRCGSQGLASLSRRRARRPSCRAPHYQGSGPPAGARRRAEARGRRPGRPP
jgi:DNA invertase Pin-like site-specific DNA recombinase